MKSRFVNPGLAVKLLLASLLLFLASTLPLDMGSPSTGDAAVVLADGHITFAGRTLVASELAPDGMNAPEFQFGRFAITVAIAPSLRQLTTTPTIAAYSHGTHINWSIEQEQHSIKVVHRGRVATFRDVIDPAAGQQSFTIVLAETGASISEDNEYLLTRAFNGEIDAWHGHAYLTIANNATGDYPWAGEISGLSLCATLPGATEFPARSDVADRGQHCGSAQYRLDLSEAARVDSLELLAPGGSAVTLRVFDWPWALKYRSLFTAEYAQITVRDLLLNCLLTVPLGVSIAMTMRQRRRLVVCSVAFGVALLLSIVVESMQLFSHTRVSSFTDIGMNSVGSLIGALAFNRFGRTTDR